MVDAEKIKEITEEFFAKSGMENVEVRTSPLVGDSGNPKFSAFDVNVVTTDASLYIGEKGRNIEAFEQVLRTVLKKKFGEFIVVHLDINNYRGLRAEGLKELARKAAHRARLYKKDIALEPMTASDRRVVHSELSAHPDIKTESMGEDPRRKIVIKYIP